jgi:uncharacterized protein YecE (DUF72 family)
MLPGLQKYLFQSPARETSLRIGPAGWNYKDWEGIVYPPGAGKKFDALAYLADYFDTIEINSSFYAPPKPEVAASWARRVCNNPRFRFTAKVWQRLTHEQDRVAFASEFAETTDLVRRTMAPLADAGALAMLLIQFPWSFRNTPENQDYIDRLLRSFTGFRLAVEVRHGSWDDENFYAFLRARHASFCNVDQPVIGDSLGPSAQTTAETGYLRLHGRNYKAWFQEDAGRDARYDYLYSKPEVKEMAGRIRSITQGTDETYVITNNHFRGQALVNAIELLEELDAQPPEVPPPLAAAYPQLRRAQ